MQTTDTLNLNFKVNKISAITHIVYICVIIGLYLFGLRNFLLFHTIIELFCVIVAYMMFVMAFNTYKINTDDRLIFIGIAFGFVGIFDILHIFSYEGIGLFQSYSANLSIQLSLISKYMGGITFLLSVLPYNNKLNLKKVLLGYTLTSLLALLSIFYFKNFPSCFIEGQGLTTFKIASEFVICGILFTTIYLRLKNKENKINSTSRLVIIGLLITIGSELFFINYVNLDDKQLLIGHILKLISYYFIYRALIKSSLKEPYYSLVKINNIFTDKNRDLENAILKIKFEYDLAEQRKVEICELEENIQVKQAIIEKTKEYDELKDIFLSTVSHELRTPLTIILGTLQLIDNVREDTDCPQYQKLSNYMNIMKQNCYRLIKLSNNLIDINKIDSGFLSIKIRNQDIISVIEDITFSVADYIKSKGITLIFDTNVEEKIMAFDSYLMDRIMLNLLSNSVKFTEKGGEIQVNVVDCNDKIMIKVRDNGIGIPKDKADIIFDRFRQVDSSLNRKSEGSGIGLALVKLIVEQHKGHIYINTDLDNGTEFIIELPVYLVEEDVKEIYIPEKSNVERIDIEFSDIYDI